MSGQLCLRWNNHATAFENLLSKIFLEDAYSDATILCQGKFYPVHRFVLSTCSEYFEEMFGQCVRLNNKHPFIIVKDIHPDQMEALLNYMYRGEVNVPQEMLPELIKAAEAFKIKGLAVPDEEPTLKLSRKRSKPSSPLSAIKKSKKQEERTSSNSESNFSYKSLSQKSFDDSSPQTCDNTKPSTSIVENINKEEHNTLPTVKLEVLDPEIYQKNNQNERNLMEESPINAFSEDNSNIEPFDFDHSNISYAEQDCDQWDDANQEYANNEGTGGENPSQRLLQDSSCFTANKITLGRNRIGGKRDRGKRLRKECPFPNCFYYTVNSGHLKDHMRRHTGEKPFQCSLCPYKAAQNSTLSKHIKLIHPSLKRFYCSQCPFKATNDKLLRDHIQTIH